MELDIGARGQKKTRMMGLPDGRKRFKIGLAVLIQHRRVTDSHPASHVAVASSSSSSSSVFIMTTDKDRAYVYVARVEMALVQSVAKAFSQCVSVQCPDSVAIDRQFPSPA